MTKMEKESIDFLQSYANLLEEDRYVIYGTGEVAQIYAKQLINKYGNDSIAYFIDSTAFVKELFGKKVYRPFEIDKSTLNNYNYILGTLSKSDSMKNTLLEMGVKIENIVKSVNFFNVENFIDSNYEIKSICYYPKITDTFKLNELEAKFNKYVYLDDSEEVQVNFIVDKNVQYNGEKKKGLYYINEQKDFNQYDLIIVWDIDYLNDDVLKEHERIICIDNRFLHIIDVKFLTALCMRIQTPLKKEYYEMISKNNFGSLVKKAKSKEKAIILANGPSIKHGVDQFIKPDDNNLKIVCNQIYKENELLEHINPDIYCLVDSSTITPAFQEIVDGTITYIKKNDCKLVIVDSWIPYFLHNYKGLEEKIIGVSIYSKKINFPTQENFCVMRSNNVATAIMTPIASSLCDVICFIGCDGFKNDDKKNSIKNWEHYGKVNIESKEILDNREKRDNCVLGKIDTIDEYYEVHKKYFREIIEYGEKLGKKYVSLTKSYIPVLSERYVRSDNKL